MNHLHVMEKIRSERIAKRSFPDNIDNSSKKSESVGISKNSGGNPENIDEKSDTDKLLEQLKNNEPTSDNKFFRLAILMYELGDLNRSMVYSERFKDDEKAKIAHLANGKLALADVLTQIYLFCQSVGWNFNELRKLGAEHLKERQEDFKRQGWRDIK